MTTALDDALEIGDDAPDREAAGDAHVCDVTDGDAVCGETFDTAGKLNQHRWLKHKIRKDGGTGPSGDKKPSRKPRKRGGAKKPEPLATPDTDRTAAYTAGIATIGLGAFLAVPKFDAFDHGCVNAGAPAMAAALDALGERHPTVRDACDLILGAGSGGPYVQLLLASLAIGVPIAAHHGWLPDSAGERFGAIAGVTMPPPEQARPVEDVPSPNGDVPHYNPNEWTADEWMSHLQGMPPNVSAELASRMMAGAGAVFVEVPDNDEASVPDGERGSEQLGPVVAVDTDAPS